MYIYVHYMCAVAQGGQRESDTLALVVRGSCEPPDVDVTAENQT